jgi:hypothetical protein
MLQKGEPLHVAQYAIAAIIDPLPGVATMNNLPRARKALRGFRKARPPRSRAPICKEIMCGLVAHLLSVGKPKIALLMAMTFFLYCRLGELRTAKRAQLLPPVRKKGALSHWTLSLAPQIERPGQPQAVTKTGVVDDAVICRLGWAT